MACQRAASPRLTARLPGAAAIAGPRGRLAGLALPLPQVPQLLVPALQTQTVTASYKSYKELQERLQSPVFTNSRDSRRGAAVSTASPCTGLKGAMREKSFIQGNCLLAFLYFLVASVNYASDTRHNGLSMRRAHL